MSPEFGEHNERRARAVGSGTRLDAENRPDTDDFDLVDFTSPQLTDYLQGQAMAIQKNRNFQANDEIVTAILQDPSLSIDSNEPQPGKFLEPLANWGKYQDLKNPGSTVDKPPHGSSWLVLTRPVLKNGQIYARGFVCLEDNQQA